MTLRPASVVATETCLRLFAEWLVDHDPEIRSLRQLTRPHVQDYKQHLVTRDHGHGTPLKKITINPRLSVLRVTIERLIELSRRRHGTARVSTRVVIVTNCAGLSHDPCAERVGCTNLPRAPIARISIARVSSRRGSTRFRTVNACEAARMRGGRLACEPCETRSPLNMLGMHT